MIKILQIVLLFTFSLYGASFNCQKAYTSIEKQICSDANLSKLDEELAKVYKDVLKLSKENKLSAYEGRSNYHFFKQTQKKWMKARNRNCKNYKGKEQKECLMSYYTSRIAKLKEFDNGSMVYRNFGNLLYLYTHRPFIIKNFKPYLDKASYQKLSQEILAWEKSYDVCKNKFGVIDDNCAKKVAKKKQAYYDDLLAQYKNSRYLKENGKCIQLKRTVFSFEDEGMCHIYKIYKIDEIQKLCKGVTAFEEDAIKIPKNAKSCSRETNNIFEANEQSISYITQNVVVVKNENYDYTGGAHGDYSSDYYNLDRNSGKIILWSNLFGKEKKVLYPFIVKHVRDLIGFENVERLSDDELYDMAASTSRMQLTPKGVVIAFGLYEISGYADGEPSFLIPLKVLQKHMNYEKYNYYFGAKPLKLLSVCKVK